MTESIYWRNEIIFRFSLSIFHDECIQHVIVWIGEKYRFNVRVIYTHMLHAVFFLVSSCQLMLLDHSCLVITLICAND